jgi:hypothetical protein
MGLGEISTAKNHEGISELAEAIRDEVVTASQISATLNPILKELAGLNEYDLSQTLVAANPADFMATTLLRSETLGLRLHIHALGASDSDFHAHKGHVRSHLISGGMVNSEVTPTIHSQYDPRGSFDVWQCGSPGGKHTQQKTELTASIDLDAALDTVLAEGDSFMIEPGDYHKIAAGDDPNEPTMSLCLFEFNDTRLAEPYILTQRTNPTVQNRMATPAFARVALAKITENIVD